MSLNEQQNQLLVKVVVATLPLISEEGTFWTLVKNALQNDPLFLDMKLQEEDLSEQFGLLLTKSSYQTLFDEQLKQLDFSRKFLVWFSGQLTYQEDSPIFPSRSPQIAEEVEKESRQRAAKVFGRRGPFNSTCIFFLSYCAHLLVVGYGITASYRYCISQEFEECVEDPIKRFIEKQDFFPRMAFKFQERYFSFFGVTVVPMSHKYISPLLVGINSFVYSQIAFVGCYQIWPSLYFVKRLFYMIKGSESVVPYPVYNQAGDRIDTAPKQKKRRGISVQEVLFGSFSVYLCLSTYWKAFVTFSDVWQFFMAQSLKQIEPSAK